MNWLFTKLAKAIIDNLRKQGVTNTTKQFEIIQNQLLEIVQDFDFLHIELGRITHYLTKEDEYKSIVIDMQNALIDKYAPEYEKEKLIELNTKAYTAIMGNVETEEFYDFNYPEAHEPETGTKIEESVEVPDVEIDKNLGYKEGDKDGDN